MGAGGWLFSSFVHFFFYIPIVTYISINSSTFYASLIVTAAIFFYDIHFIVVFISFVIIVFDINP